MSRLTDIESAELLRKKKRALDLRLRSMSYAAIAEEIGVSVMTARAYVQEATVTYLPPEETEELRTHELAKIDADEEMSNKAIEMLIAQGQRVANEGGSITDVVEAIRRWQDSRRELRKQRAMLLGLNKPVLVEHMHKVKTDYDEEIESLVSELTGGGKVMSLPEDVILEDGSI